MDVGTRHNTPGQELERPQVGGALGQRPSVPQALRLPPPAAPSMTAEVSPLSAPLLLGSPALGSLLSAPPAPSVQRRLALSCVLHGR